MMKKVIRALCVIAVYSWVFTLIVKNFQHKVVQYYCMVSGLLIMTLVVFLFLGWVFDLITFRRD